MNPSAPPSVPGASRPLLLASRSLRRRSLLTEAGLPHRAVAPSLDDARLRPTAAPAPEWVCGLAYLKAEVVRRMVDTDLSSVILGADTVVVKEGDIIGQPHSREEAERTLHRLEDGRHHVLTGVAIVCASTARRVIFADAAEVRVGRLGPERIEAYLDSEDWRGKAGAYNLAERLVDGWPIEFQGDPTSVMGLPMRRLAPLLRRLGAESDAGGPRRSVA